VGVLLDFILLLVLSRAFWKLVGGVMTGMQSRNQPSAGPAPRPSGGSVHMERDPVCGTFVVPERAVVLADGRERAYFCSTSCRDEYAARHAKGKAS
jgi:YHS domain-containing protein